MQRRTPVGSGEVELEWLENPASPITEVLHHPEVLVGNGTPISDSAVADNLSQPTAVPVNSGARVAVPSQTQVTPSRELSQHGSKTMLEQLYTSQDCSRTL